MAVLSPKGNPMNFYILDEAYEAQLDGGQLPVEIQLAISQALPEGAEDPKGCHIAIDGEAESFSYFKPEWITTLQGLAADENCTVTELLRITLRVECRRCPVPDCRGRHEEFIDVHAALDQ